ncbi:RICIN domain-containing protein [Streptomyces hygroscopicus subsp. hygroscopicus]|uniref:RICIN domain-containing protein n=1 Tax=Streptomyces hygroscopicus TaxID=1912 RepID=UPI001C657675|nr:RICIN domain-containing protein [Streptomyces hygroscopicus]MBW8092941.1 RICIN domain-containing protein [Streptomyces hygroscopicus subsp. hygroscopicus]
MSLVRQAALGGTLLALALTGLAVTPAGAAAPGGPATRAAGQTVILHTVNDPNLVADLAYGSSTDGTPVTLYPEHGGTNQQWEVVPVQGNWFQLRNKASGTCLVNGHHSVDNGHQLAGYGCNPGYEDQLWARVGVENSDQFTLVNKYSGKCMDQTLNGTALTQLTQWDCHGESQQRWTATTV